MSFSEVTNFILKHEEKDSKDSISILGNDLNLIWSVNYDHSMKMPQMLGNVPTNRRVRTTDVRIEGKDGRLICEIHEIPTGTMRLIRKWEVYDDKRNRKGVVSEKPKFIGSDWVLESVEGNLLAVVDGDRKKNNYEIVTPDKGKQCIARCISSDESSYKVEMMVSSIDSFLVVSYVIVLDLVKTASVITGRRF